MQYILLWLISIPFLYLNYKIVKSDLEIKKIPNKLLMYLLFLLPLYYLYIFLYFDVNYLIFTLQVIITFIICFIIYSFWLWWAWDAKYLLTLGIFIPNIWIFVFIWNIAIIMILYLFIYFIWFYLWKCLFDLKYSRKLYWDIYINLKDKLINYLSDTDWNLYKKVIFVKLLKWLIIFLVVFVSIRFIRLILINEFLTNWWDYNLLEKFLYEYFIYIFIWIIIIFTWMFYIIRKIYSMFSNKISIRFKKEKLTIDLYFALVLLFFLVIFLIYEYTIDPVFVKITLYRIFTIMLLIFFIFITLFYLYKVAFQIAETDYKNIKDLKVWEILDREYLIENFWTQSLIWYCPKWTQENLKKEREGLILYPDPKKYFAKLRWPINNEDFKIIKNVYDIVNKNWNKNEVIKTIKTFSLWWYIFLWFLITFIFENEIFKYIIWSIIYTIRSFYNI